jgi:hypothetical protein
MVTVNMMAAHRLDAMPAIPAAISAKPSSEGWRTLV